LGNTSGWVRLGGGLPHVTARGLEINYQVNRIRVGTTGRGVWEHGLHCPVDLDLVESGTYAANDFLEAEHDIISTAIVPSAISMKYRGGNQVHLQPGFHAIAGSSFHAFIHPCDDPGNSFTPKTGAGAGGPGDESVLSAAGGLVKVFPNPSTGSLSVHIEGVAPGSRTSVRLFDGTGKLVHRSILVGAVGNFEVLGPTGLYLLQLEGPFGAHTERIVLDRIP
jgi:hypothetical protein